MHHIRSFSGISPKLADDAWVDESAVVIGDVEIGSGSSIWPATVVRGDVNQIRIGENTNIQDGCVLHVTHASPLAPEGAPLHIGSGVTAGHKVILHGCTIGDYCLIGMGAVVMDGAVIESKVIVAAGSLVPEGKVLESGYLYRGSPARQARPLSDKEQGFLEYVSGHYVKLAKQYKDEATQSN